MIIPAVSFYYAALILKTINKLIYMIINTIANHLRQSQGASISLEMAKAELAEIKKIKCKNIGIKLHIKTLESYIKAKSK